LIYPPIPLILKSIQKFTKEGKRAIMIVPKWKVQTPLEVYKDKDSIREFSFLEKYPKNKGTLVGILAKLIGMFTQFLKTSSLYLKYLSTPESIRKIKIHGLLKHSE
jgi:hypothetical protein